MSQVLMMPEEGGVRVRAFWSILQHDVFTDQNFVYGVGLWNAWSAKDADGEWRLKSVTVEIWRGKDVPRVGEARARSKRS
jgi:hypothetical protein